MIKASAIVVLLVTFVAGTAAAGNFGTSASHQWGGAPATAAGSSLGAASTPKISGYNGTFKLGQTSVFAGICPDGYANQCASGTCECHEFTGTAKGSFGSSTDVVFELTLDLDNQPGDPDGTCFPAFGVLFFQATQKNVVDSEVVDVVGAACSNFDHSSVFNGGFEFNNFSTVIFDAQGSSAVGKFTGSTAFQLKLTGKACKGAIPCS